MYGRPRGAVPGHLQSFEWTPRRTFRCRLRPRQRAFGGRRVIGRVITLSRGKSVSDGQSLAKHARCSRLVRGPMRSRQNPALPFPISRCRLPGQAPIVYRAWFRACTKGELSNPGVKRISPARQPFSHLMRHTPGGAIFDATSSTTIVVVELLLSAVITTCQNHPLQLANQTSSRKVAGINSYAVPCLAYRLNG